MRLEYYTPLQKGFISVNPQACARYLIWKELITCVVTSCVQTEVVFSIPEEFLFPILRLYNELRSSPTFSTCSTKVKYAAAAFEAPKTPTVRPSYRIVVVLVVSALP